MTTETFALIIGASAVIISFFTVLLSIWIQRFIDSVEHGKRLPGAVNISECECKGVKSVKPEKKMLFNDWAKKYVRPFSKAKPNR